MRTRILALLMTTAMALPALAESRQSLGPIQDVTTKTECSACHIAYPARFLPARSWEALLGDLGNHFGEDASLAPDVAETIKAYLIANAGDAGGRKFRAAPTDQTPLRISELPWFKREHEHEVSAARLKKAGSWSNCVSCHAEAANGLFGDD